MKPKRPDPRAKGAPARMKTRQTSIKISAKFGSKHGSRPKATVVIKNTVSTSGARASSSRSIGDRLPHAKSLRNAVDQAPPAKRARGKETALALPTTSRTGASAASVRAKPFISKASPDTLSRLSRALKQRLYLCRHERHSDGLGARFAVFGSTGNVYEVSIGLLPTCTCIDFVAKKKPCKHLLFVWLRVLKKRQNNPLVWQQALVASEVRSSLNPFFLNGGRNLPIADKKVLKAFSARSKARRHKLGRDCPICFETTSIEDERKGLLTFCESCGHNVHKECLQLWRKASSRTVLAGACPVCHKKMGSGTSRIVAPGAATRWGRIGAPGKGYLNLAASSSSGALALGNGKRRKKTIQAKPGKRRKT